jgi:hypothetical protein
MTTKELRRPAEFRCDLSGDRRLSELLGLPQNGSGRVSFDFSAFDPDKGRGGYRFGAPPVEQRSRGIGHLAPPTTAVLARGAAIRLLATLDPPHRPDRAAPLTRPALFTDVRRGCDSDLARFGLGVGCLPLHAGTESLRTHRWREVDSNFQFRAR